MTTTATDPLDTLRDHVSVWRADAATYERVGLSPAAARAFRQCAADVESVLTVIEAGLTVARDFVCWLPEHEVWVASGSHPTTAARAFAEALNQAEVEG